MSELQLSMLTIGALIVGGMYFYNRLQERKYRRQAQQAFQASHQDALFSNPDTAQDAAVRIEPSLSPAPDEYAAPLNPAAQSARAYAATQADFSPAHPPAATQPLASPASAPSAPDAPPQAARQPASAASASTKAEPEPLIIDEAIDFVATIRPGKSIQPEDLQTLIQTSQTLGKPVHWEGLSGGQWHTLHGPSGAVLKALRVGLQLADRRGRLGEAELLQLIKAVQQFAADYGGVSECEAEDSALERAAALDNFCADVDVEIAINIQCPSAKAFSGIQVRESAEAAGLALTPEGVFELVDDGARCITLSNAEPRPFINGQIHLLSTHALTLTLDVPRVANGAQTFQRMHVLAQHIAQSLGGQVVDDNYRPLTAAATDSICQQLGEIQTRMRAEGIAPGSRLARRLFS